MSGFRIEGNTSGNVVEVTGAHALMIDGSATTQPVSIAATVAVAITGTATVGGTVSLSGGSAAIGSVSVSSSALPSGAATATLQSSILAALGSPMQAAGGSVAISGSVTIGSSALPTGAATAALQSSILTAVQQPLAAGTNAIGIVTQQPLTKGTQNANGVQVQDFKDAGRNLRTFFQAAQTTMTATEALVSLLGYSAGAAVAATTTPAVVSAGKTLRLQSLVITMVQTSATVPAAAQVQIRANSSGLVTVTSPLVYSVLIGIATPTEAVGQMVTTDIDLPDGMEFPAGTGIGITVLGITASSGVATAVGQTKIALTGFEY